MNLIGLIIDRRTTLAPSISPLSFIQPALAHLVQFAPLDSSGASELKPRDQSSCRSLNCDNSFDFHSLNVTLHSIYRAYFIIALAERLGSKPLPGVPWVPSQSGRLRADLQTLTIVKKLPSSIELTPAELLREQFSGTAGRNFAAKIRCLGFGFRQLYCL